MPKALPLRDDYSAADLRQLARETHHANQARRLLALAALMDGKSRTEAARIGATQRQTLWRWINAFNEAGPAGLIDVPQPGRPPKLSSDQIQELIDIVKTGPDPASETVVRWRCIDLRDMIQERFGIPMHQSTVARILREQGFSHISARPQHPRQDPEGIEDFKKNYPDRSTPL
jgi:transposase